MTSNDIANTAILLMGGNQPAVTGQAPTFDDSTNGQALQKLYVPCVRTVLQQFGWNFARNLAALALSGNPANVLWTYEYVYPPFGVEVWQIVPAAIADPNNPLPVTWNVANNLVNDTQTKVIQTNLADAMAVFNNAPSEATWEPLFREAVERLLASEMAMATASKPETSAGYLQSGAAFENLGEARSG